MGASYFIETFESKRFVIMLLDIRLLVVRVLAIMIL